MKTYLFVRYIKDISKCIPVMSSVVTECPCSVAVREGCIIGASAAI
jgi:hypothetical protein